MCSNQRPCKLHRCRESIAVEALPGSKVQTARLSVFSEAKTLCRGASTVVSTCLLYSVSEKLLTLFAKITYIFCKKYLHCMQKSLTLFAKITYIACKNYLHCLQKLLTLFTKITYIVCKNYLHCLQRLLTLFAKITYIICKNYLHCLQKLLTLLHLNLWLQLPRKPYSQLDFCN